MSRIAGVGVNAPYGFKPSQTSHGGPPRISIYPFNGGATAIFPGDLVKLETDGEVAPLAAATDEPILGVAANYVAANSAVGTNVYVYDDPEQIFEAQVDDTLLDDYVGDLCDPVISSGDATRKLSQHAVNPDAAVTSSLQIVAKHPADDYGQYARVMVRIAKHHYTQVRT
jgi:hypothetical protein